MWKTSVSFKRPLQKNMINNNYSIDGIGDNVQTSEGCFGQVRSGKADAFDTVVLGRYNLIRIMRISYVAECVNSTQLFTKFLT